MFWVRNKKNNFPLRTLIWGPALQTNSLDLNQDLQNIPLNLRNVRFLKIYISNALYLYNAQFLKIYISMHYTCIMLSFSKYTSQCIIPVQCSASQNIHINALYLYNAQFLKIDISLHYTCIMLSFSNYSKTYLNGHSKINKTKILMTNGRKYCRMLPLEHSAILLTCIKR